MKKNLSNAQREFLHFAYLAPTRGWDGVCPGRGQHKMVRALESLGMLRFIGWGRDADAESAIGRDVELFAITDEGCRTIEVSLRGGHS